MALEQATFDQPNHRLTINEIITALLEDGRVDKSVADDFLIPTRSGGVEVHPLVVISQQDWTDLKNSKKTFTLDVLSEWMADRAGLAYIRIDPLKVDVTAVTSVMSSAYATRHKILPIEVNEHTMTVATAEPYLRDWEGELSHVNNLKIERVICNPAKISRYLTEFYSVSQSIRTATSENENEMLGGTNFEQLIELGKSGQLDTNDKSVVHIVDWLLQFAFDQRASDIHLEPRRDMSNIRFRIDGVMHTVYEMPTPVMTVVIARIKVLGRMDVVEKRRPQDGRIKSKTPNGDEIELRLSTMPTAFGEKMVMRIFSPDVLVKDFSGLGFSDKDLTSWNSMISQPHGIVLVTGPTGSGKTTTLYSTLKKLAQPEVNVCSVEDPIEMVMAEFNQMQVQHNIGVDFASGIRTLLRQDPDIIMVGEIRDKETAEMATQAALTGHLVLSTLHTNDASAAIPRLREIGIPAYLINATIIGVMAQRLVRTLCSKCKEPTEVDEVLWKTLTHPWKIKGQGTFCKPVGCEDCRHTGFMGRVGIYEVMILDRELRATINQEIDSKILRDMAVKSGMTVMRISGARKVALGLTTIEEVMKVVPPDEEI